MTERELLMRKIASTDFALIDLHLFLDTHPNNLNIAKKIEDYEMKSRQLRNEYERQFGPLTLSSEEGNRWQWISNPWPWDSISEKEC